MKIAGFSFVRNAIKYDYPVLESIQSILKICDEFVIAVGRSDDATLNLVKSINSPKIKILETVWDDNLRQGGTVLAIETQKALDAVSPDADWAFYIQADEVVHENYLPAIENAMHENMGNEKVEALLFHYKHFFGSYDYVADSRSWYRREIRIVRNTRKVRSYKDAQGFRKEDGQKLSAKLIDAYIYHYGWVKPPEAQQKKQETFNKYWHDDKWIAHNVPQRDKFDYSLVDSLSRFTASHPQVMFDRITKKNWVFTHDISKKNLSYRFKILMFIERLTGYRIGEYRNYRLT